MEMKITGTISALLQKATPRATQSGQGGQGGGQAVIEGAQGGTAPTPEAPRAPRVITIHNSDGSQTTVGVPSDFNASDVIPPQVEDISIAFFVTMAIIIIGLPLARAFARRMDRKSAPAQISNEVSSQLTQLTHAVDAIALEVERISEGQRFTTRLLSEQRDARQTLPAPTGRS